MWPTRGQAVPWRDACWDTVSQAGAHSLVVGRAAGAQKAAAGLLQAPVAHLQHFVALTPRPQTQPKELLHLREQRVVPWDTPGLKGSRQPGAARVGAKESQRQAGGEG